MGGESIKRRQISSHRSCAPLTARYKGLVPTLKRDVGIDGTPNLECIINRVPQRGLPTVINSYLGRSQIIM